MKLCYDQPYNHVTRSADLEACASQGSQVFVAGTYGSTVVLGAGGATSCVFQATSNSCGTYSTARACNGAFWYNSNVCNGKAFGFAGSSTIYLANPDIANLPGYGQNTGADDGATRLCWLMDSGYSWGGWRLGTQMLMGDSTYRKRIWVSSITTASPSYAGTPANIGPSFAAARDERVIRQVHAVQPRPRRRTRRRLPRLQP